jgi:hypothetical protein
MLIIVHDGRGTSPYVLLHPYLPDVHPASLLLILQNKFSCFTGGLDHFSCCDTLAVPPDEIMARYRTIDLFS